MEKVILQTRAEMTRKMLEMIKSDYTCYRVRVACNCKPKLSNPEMYTQANQRNGVLVIDGVTVKMLFIRCRLCGQSVELATNGAMDAPNSPFRESKTEIQKKQYSQF